MNRGISKKVIFSTVVALAVIISYSSAQTDLSCLKNNPTIQCSDYKLCDTCKQGTIECDASNNPVLKCQTCNQFSFIIDGVTYCSSSSGCSQLNKVTGNCEKCKQGFYATYFEKSPTEIEIKCSDTKINLGDVLTAIDALTAYTKTQIFNIKQEIIYKYTLKELSSTTLVEQVRPIFYYSRYIEECGGKDKADNIYENCQCKAEYYGSRCQLQRANNSTINAEIKNNIVPALTNLQTTFSVFSTVAPVDQYLDTYPGLIINILRLIAEVAEGLDKETFTAFNTAQQSFIDFINTKYDYTYWQKPNSLTTDTTQILNWSVLYSFISVYAERLSYTADNSLKSEYLFDSSTLVKPDEYLFNQLETFYTKTMGEDFTASTKRTLKATKMELNFQLIKELPSAVTQLNYGQAESATFNFMSLESLSTGECINMQIEQPRFFISRKAYQQLDDKLKPSGGNNYHQVVFINQFSSNPYSYKNTDINSPIVQSQFLYGLTTNKQYSQLQSYEITLQQDYMAVLIPKFKTQIYNTASTSSISCKVLNEKTNEWSDSSDLGVDNDQTIECSSYVICFYDIQKNFAKKRRFAFQIEFQSEQPDNEFFAEVKGSYWRTSGFFIPIILIFVFFVFLVLFLFVSALNSQNAPKRKIEIQEYENQKVNSKYNTYRTNENIYTDNMDTEGRGHTDRLPQTLNHSQQHQDGSSAQIVETTEMDAMMSYHVYSIVHTTERSYKVQKISILIMNWHFIGCFLAIMYKFLEWKDSNIVVGIVYTIIASWFANYIWGFIAVKFRRTVEGSPSVSALYYVLFVALFCFLFFIELQATEYQYNYHQKQKWHGVGFLICVVIDYLIFDTILIFVYQSLAQNHQACFHGLGSILRHRGFYQH